MIFCSFAFWFWIKQATW